MMDFSPMIILICLPQLNLIKGDYLGKPDLNSWALKMDWLFLPSWCRAWEGFHMRTGLYCWL